IAVALFELGLGVVLGNVFTLHSQQWLDFIAAFASIVLTFLAGAEVDPDDFRQRFGAAVGIGVVSFVGPFVVAWLVAWGPLGWTLKASLMPARRCRPPPWRSSTRSSWRPGSTRPA